MKIQFFVSISLRDTRVTDKLKYDHCAETRYNPEHYPHHLIAGYALFARITVNGETLDHHLGFETDRDAIDGRVESADRMYEAFKHYETA